jgi:hypothetical protein
VRRFLLATTCAAALLSMMAAPAMAGQLIVPAVVAALGVTGTAATVLGAVLSIGASFILSAVARSLAGKPKQTGLTGRQDMIRQPVVARRTIYGRQKVSGPIVFANAFGTAYGVKNAYLSLIVALAGHECDAVEEIWFNDVQVTFDTGGVPGEGVVSAPFKHGASTDAAWVYKHLGSPTQAADSVLIADAGDKWGADYRLRGICYLHTRLLFFRDGTLWADGIPQVRAVVRGKKLYDTRTSTTAWSSNPALCVYDYLTSVLGITAAEIDTASVNAAANTCDGTVTLKSGQPETRYTCHGVFDSDERPADVLSKLLSSMAGTLVYSGGTFFLHAGAATAATLTLDEDDLAGGIVVHPRVARREALNAVKAIFVNKDKNYQPEDAPTITSATYVAQDNGETILQTLDLPFTVTSSMAQRLAKIELERARQQITVECTVKQVGLQLKAWDTVLLTNTLYGWNAKKFRVEGWRLNEDVTVGLVLREEADAMWDFDPTVDETAVDAAPDTNLPDPRDVPAPGAFAFVEELRTTATGAVVTALEITFGAVSDGLVVGYEAQFKKSTQTTWRTLGGGQATIHELAPVVDGTTYDFRVRSVNGIGALSGWTTGSYTVNGQSDPPADVTNFTINPVGNQAELAWDAVTDVDLSHYRVRFSSATAGVSWATSTDLRKRVSKHATSVTVPFRVGTYLIKAVDLKGNESTNETTIVTTVPAIHGLNAVATITESPAFGGTFVNTAAPEGVLQLDTTTLFDSAAGNFDDMTGLFDSGGGAGFIDDQGTYAFATTLDLGAVYYPNRVSFALQVTTIDYASLFDDAPGNFDSRQGLFDGAIVGEVGVVTQVRTTDDDPAGAPTWSAWRAADVGDFKARGMQFRVVLKSDNVQATPGVSALSVTVDMPDRVERGEDVAVPAGGLAVTFPTGGFKAVPALGVTVQDGAVGDRIAITAKTKTGFTVRVFDSGGTGVARTVDWLARGYGIAA